MEDFVSYDIAVKLKEKGFREKCKKHCYPNSQDWFISSTPECDNFSNYLDIPTIYQVLKWLRDEKKLFVDIGMAYNKYYVGICKTDEFDEVMGRQVIEHAIGTPSNTYEKAALAGVNYCLENLI